MSDELSEHARLLYEAILEEGFISPAHTWEQYSILDVLGVTSGNSYDWLRELKGAGKIVTLPSTTIDCGDTFYAVPPSGFQAVCHPGHVTTWNKADHLHARNKRKAGKSHMDSLETRIGMATVTKDTVEQVYSAVVINNNFQPTMTQHSSAPDKGSTYSTAPLWGSWGTWIGVIVSVAGVLAALYAAGKI